MLLKKGLFKIHLHILGNPVLSGLSQTSCVCQYSCPHSGVVIDLHEFADADSMAVIQLRLYL